MADLPILSGRGIGAGFSIAGKGYFGFGYDGGTYYNDLYQYDTATNMWTQMASSPGPILELPVCMVIGNIAYIGIGKTLSATTSSSSSQLWQYNPQNNIWTRKADIPDTLQEGAFGVGIGSVGYAGLSMGTLGTKGWWQYSPTNDAWTRKADYPGSEMQWGTGFAVNGKIYSGLGNVSGPGGNNQWWQYDTATDSWTAKNSFPGNLPFFGAAFTLSGKGYVAGGYECWRYDDAGDTWTQIAFFDDRTGGSCFVIGNKAFYTAGRHEPLPNNFLQKDLWEFDPSK
jgi:N-acetylneuraminic acid mutarotase